MVFVAGQVADDLDADIAEQSRQVLAKIDSLLGSSGTGKHSILTASVWLRDIADFDRFNAVWDGWVPDGEAPARACVESKMADPRIRVEIALIAAV
jgi:enamine deaminase RidA (YjgF/YER057c/UK114 family)